MTDRWPDKTIPEFTDTELSAAIERHQDDPDSVVQEIVRSCVREWERRHGLPRT
ncbi:hypothetical protein ACFVVX_25995 [Kitasatospora sp. NPDC058170]|uniref:hypothetical protein n=1 Tax=Kitasatospora sp. NPDC058170 TaxID=3346364 RepID=UPI0036DF70E5